MAKKTFYLYRGMKILFFHFQLCTLGNTFISSEDRYVGRPRISFAIWQFTYDKEETNDVLSIPSSYLVHYNRLILGETRRYW